MEFVFEKAGKKVTATISDDNVAILTVDGYSCEVKADDVRGPNGRVWAYEVADEKIISLITRDKIKKLYLSDPSAKEIFYEIINRKKELERKKEEAEIQLIKEGKIKIQASYRDGEYLSGYSVYGLTAKLLVELKIAREINGWGTVVDDELVKKLGETFTYEQAREFAQPRLDKIEEEKRKNEAERQAKFDEAKRSGKPVILSRWTDKCNDPSEDCSLDSIVIYAMPDGSTEEKRSHTW